MMNIPGNGGSGESHKPHSASGKFLGDTKGNADLATKRGLDGSLGGSGESHAPKTASKYCGPTKGNADLATDRSSGVPGGQGGGPLKAGGGGKEY